MDPWAARDGDGDGDGDGDVVDASKKSPAPAPFDVVVAADVVYDFDVVAPLLRAARKLLGGDLAQNNSNKRARDGRFIMAHTERRPPLPRPENNGRDARRCRRIRTWRRFCRKRARTGLPSATLRSTKRTARSSSACSSFDWFETRASSARARRR